MQRIGSALVISFVGSSAFADAPPADRVVVETITAVGSGCPAGTAAVAVPPDNTAIWIAYSSYMAAVGVGSGPVDFRKNCQLNLRVHAPPGFTYAIAGGDHSGAASLAAGASAVLRTRLFFQGSQCPRSSITRCRVGSMTSGGSRTPWTRPRSCSRHATPSHTSTSRRRFA